MNFVLMLCCFPRECGSNAELRHHCRRHGPPQDIAARPKVLLGPAIKSPNSIRNVTNNYPKMFVNRKSMHFKRFHVMKRKVNPKRYGSSSLEDMAAVIDKFSRHDTAKLCVVFSIDSARQHFGK